MEGIPPTAREILQTHGVEVDAGDHRPLEEIVQFLGLAANQEISIDGQKVASVTRRASQSPYLAH